MKTPPAPDEDRVGDCAALEARIRDLEQATARQERTIAALRESDEQYRVLLAESADPISAFSTEYRYHFANRAAAEAVGQPVDQIVGRHIRDVFPEDEAEERIAVLGRVFSVGEELVVETRISRPEEERCFLTTITPVKDAGGRVHSAVCCSKDITARKQIEDALEESRERYRALSEAAFEAIFISERGICIEQNAKAVQMFGYTDAEAIGRYGTEWIAPEDRDVVMRNMLSGYEQPYQVTALRKDGSRFPAQLSGRMMHYQGRSVRVTSLTDISERKAVEEARLGLERQLLHAQKLESLGVLAGGVAHDFNNLLMAMLGNMDLALGHLPAGSPAAACIDQAIVAGRRAAGLTNRMLAYSGRGAFVIEAVDLNAMIEENAAMLKAAIAKSATFHQHLQRDLPPLIADAAQVQQIVMNLITNASEALGDRAGSITLSTGVRACDASYLQASCLDEKPAPGTFIWLEVTDSGCGMSAATAQKLFDPFFTTKFTGRGLGMSAVLGIVRGHRGAILVDSTLDAGTTIRVLFPVVAEARETPRAGEIFPEAPAHALAGRVLIVDDEDFVLSVCSAMARQLGLHVLTAVDGADAIGVFREQRESIGAVLLDMTMPRLDGLATFRELRRIDPGVRVILCSGFTEQEIAERFAGEGLAGFLQKPYGLERLRRTLGRVLEPRGERVRPSAAEAAVTRPAKSG
jgi:PAS domain S-box-containing protein